MEQSLPLIAKKAWGMVRVLLFMVRRGIISKRKLLLLDLNMMVKRGNKIASKAIGNLKFHHHHHRHEVPAAAAPEIPTSDEEDATDVAAVKMALEMINGGGDGGVGNVYAPPPPPPPYSPMPRRRKGMMRQLRITDSPFPLREDDGGDNGVVDRKADEFIANFYRQLQKQQQ
ncbi:hypothetical protein LINPERHAP2_LOCUS3826 [Linum perenne]